MSAQFIKTIGNDRKQSDKSTNKHNYQERSIKQLKVNQKTVRTLSENDQKQKKTTSVFRAFQLASPETGGVEK